MSYLIWILLILEHILAEKLKFVIEYSRHGARYSFDEIFYWTYGKSGLLTNAGMRQHYLYGKMLRKRYIEDTHFLSQSYNASEITVRTSHASRCIASAQSQLMGLYPPGSGSKINLSNQHLATPPNEADYSKYMENLADFSIDYQSQPIPIISMEGVRDPLMVPSEVCPGVSKMVETYRNEHIAEKNAKEADFKPVYKEVAKLFNVKEETINMQKTLTYRDVLMSALWEGYPIKDDATDWKVAKMTEDVDRYYSYQFYLNVQYKKRIVHKILSSSFWNHAIDLIKEKIESIEKGKENLQKFALFLGHDTMLNTIVIAAGLAKNNNTVITPFAATLLIELYEKSRRNYFISLKYDEEPAKNMTLSEFYDLISNNIYDMPTFDKYCKEFVIDPDDPEPVNHSFEYLTAILCSIAVVLAIAIIIFFAVKYAKCCQNCCQSVPTDVRGTPIEINNP